VDAGAGYYDGAFDQKFVRVFDPTTNTVTSTIRVGFGTSDIAVADTPSAELAYVTRMRQEKSRVMVVDVATGKVVDWLGVKEAPQTATTSPDQRQVWVGSSFEGRVWKVNARTHTKAGQVQVPRSGPISSIAFSPKGNRAWVTGLGGLSVVNVKTGKVVGFKPANALFPRSQNLNVGDVALNPSGSRVMVVNSTFPDSPGQGMVAVLDAQTLKAVHRIPVGREPMAVVTDPEGGQTYVPNYADNSVSYFATPKS
jgi:DNA-binding beta-propeller fold protein YncE